MGAARVLVVDDEHDYLDATSRLLTKAGYTVFTAENARKALEIVASSKVDVVISDTVMPGMKGPELLQMVGEAAPEIARMLVSGRPQAPAPGVTFLRKPFRAAELTEAVEGVLAEARRARDDSASETERAKRLTEESQRRRDELKEVVEKSKGNVTESRRRRGRLDKSEPIDR